jgi:hypothetical protein
LRRVSLRVLGQKTTRFQGIKKEIYKGKKIAGFIFWLFSPVFSIFFDFEYLDIIFGFRGKFSPFPAQTKGLFSPSGFFSKNIPENFFRLDFEYSAKMTAIIYFYESVFL